MQHLLFKEWLLSEMADYGYDTRASSRLQGGTDIIKGDQLYDVIDATSIISELVRLPSLGPNEPIQKWDNIVEWGNGVGAIQVECTTFGSLKLVMRRKIADLQGEAAWLCKGVRPLSDIKDATHEISIAHESYEVVSQLSNKLMESPAREFPDFERLAWRMWAGLKKEHPSYCMFPIGLRKQTDDNYKMVFEFRGAGQGHVDADQGFLRQFDIELVWDKKKGLVRCWGNNIESQQGRSSWDIAPQEWNEYFSPFQDHSEIIDCIVKIFMQY